MAIADRPAIAINLKSKIFKNVRDDTIYNYVVSLSENKTLAA